MRMFNENLVSFCPLKDASKLVEFVSKEQVMGKIASIFQLVLYIKLFLQCYMWVLNRKLSGARSLEALEIF